MTRTPVRGVMRGGAATEAEPTGARGAALAAAAGGGTLLGCQARTGPGRTCGVGNASAGARPRAAVVESPARAPSARARGAERTAVQPRAATAKATPTLRCMRPPTRPTGHDRAVTCAGPMPGPTQNEPPSPHPLIAGSLPIDGLTTVDSASKSDALPPIGLDGRGA